MAVIHRKHTTGLLLAGLAGVCSLSHSQCRYPQPLLVTRGGGWFGGTSTEGKKEEAKHHAKESWFWTKGYGKDKVEENRQASDKATKKLEEASQKADNKLTQAKENVKQSAHQTEKSMQAKAEKTKGKVKEAGEKTKRSFFGLWDSAAEKGDKVKDSVNRARKEQQDDKEETKRSLNKAKDKVKDGYETVKSAASDAGHSIHESEKKLVSKTKDVLHSAEDKVRGHSGAHQEAKKAEEAGGSLAKKGKQKAVGIANEGKKSAQHAVDGIKHFTEDVSGTKQALKQKAKRKGNEASKAGRDQAHWWSRWTSSKAEEAKPKKSLLGSAEEKLKEGKEEVGRAKDTVKAKSEKATEEGKGLLHRVSDWAFSSEGNKSKKGGKSLHAEAAVVESLPVLSRGRGDKESISSVPGRALQVTRDFFTGRPLLKTDLPASAVRAKHAADKAQSKVQ